MNQSFAREMRHEEEEWNQARPLVAQHEADLFKPHHPPPGAASSSRAVRPATTLSEEEVEVYRQHNVPVPDGFGTHSSISSPIPPLDTAMETQFPDRTATSPMRVTTANIPQPTPISEPVIDLESEETSAPIRDSSWPRPLKELEDRKSTRLNSSHITRSRMPSSA